MDPFESFDEAYEVVRTVELVRSGRTWRIEIVRPTKPGEHKGREFEARYSERVPIGPGGGLVWRETTRPDRPNPCATVEEAMRGACTMLNKCIVEHGC